jgi:hypothetical protein
LLGGNTGRSPVETTLRRVSAGLRPVEAEKKSRLLSQAAKDLGGISLEIRNHQNR